jgi:general secretion pathway protein I
LFRKSCCNGEAGFTLIEALVALAIIAIVLGSIGTVVATTVRGTRAIDQKLALSGAAETLLSTLPARGLLKLGRQSGELAGHRWRLDVAPMNVGEIPPDARFIPLTVSLRLQAPGGQLMQLTTVRLTPRASE